MFIGASAAKPAEGRQFRLYRGSLMRVFPPVVIGVLAALASALIGAGWQIATRWGATTSLHPLDLALMRYVAPGLILLPILFRHGLAPRGVSAPTMIVMIASGGLPFGLLAMMGAQFAPVAHMAALLPGSMPLFVALLAWIAFKEKLTTLRAVGLCVVIAGIALIAAPAFSASHSGQWLGDLLFLLASLFWAFFTIAFRKSGLGAWHGAAIVSFWSALAVAPLWWFAGANRLGAAPAYDIALQFMMQGVVAGVLGLATFTIAVKFLGAQRAALSGALVQIFSVVGGALLLREQPTVLTMIGVALTTAGVAIASQSGALKATLLRSHPTPSPSQRA